MAEQVSSNLITLISANTLRGLKSGNYLIDVLFSIVLIMMIPVLMDKMRKINIGRFLWFAKSSDKYKIKLTGTTKYGKYGEFRRNFSDAFCALSKFMETKCDLKSTQEFFTTSFQNNTEYMPRDSLDIVLTSDITCDVRQYYNEDGSFTVDYELSSDISLKHIQNFLYEQVMEYKERMADELHRKQRYFCPDYVEARVEWKNYTFESSKTMDTIFFPEKHEMLKRLDHFTNGRELYQSKGVPWTLGILLSGLPGTGKSSLVKALANYTGRHIIEVPLGRIKTYGALKEVMLGEEVKRYKIPFDKRLYLMEDIDCLDEIVLSRQKTELSEEKKKKKIDFDWSKSSGSGSFSNNDPLTLSHILNIIDGPLEAPGRILIMTSNHPERLDEALIRDGRMDIKLEMKPLRGKCLQDMVLSFFPEKTSKDLSDDSPLKNSDSLSPATIQNLCFMGSFEEVCERLQ